MGLPNRKTALCLLAAAVLFTLPFRAAGREELRGARYTSRSAEEARLWQQDLRSRLSRLLRLDDLAGEDVPLEPKILSSEEREGYTFHEVEIRSTPERRIRLVFTVPSGLEGPFPAVVVISGHGGSRYSCYKPEANHYRFGHVLAGKGFVTVSTDVSWHEVREAGRTLTGERLWDLRRAVDYLTSRDEVDAQRIGTAGYSLGAEMAMWLAAMDERVVVTVSSGFLTRMDHVEQGHCPCWKFPGLRPLVDFADVYSLIAPRRLLCQSGLREPEVTGFPISIAREALAEIKTIYTDLQVPENLSFVAHEGDHEVHLPSMVTFLETHLP